MLFVVVGDSHIERLSLTDGIVQRKSGLFKGRIGVKNVVVINVNVVESKPFKALVERSGQVFAGAVFVSVRPRPHIVSRFCCDDKFVAVLTEAAFENAAKIFFG